MPPRCLTDVARENNRVAVLMCEADLDFVLARLEVAQGESSSAKRAEHFQVIREVCQRVPRTMTLMSVPDATRERLTTRLAEVEAKLATVDGPGGKKADG